ADGLSRGGNNSNLADRRRVFVPGLKKDQRQCESGGSGKNRREKGEALRAERFDLFTMDSLNRSIGHGGGSSLSGGEGASEIRILGRKSIHGCAAGGAAHQMLLEHLLIGGGNFAVDAG